VALVESGAADAFGLGSEHIALACASHAAQPFQVELVTRWLERLELERRAGLRPALPRGTADIVEACRHGGGPRRIYNNCSGKHCGFLSMARHMGGGSAMRSAAIPRSGSIWRCCRTSSAATPPRCPGGWMAAGCRPSR
jgi:L-asparaginase II